LAIFETTSFGVSFEQLCDGLGEGTGLLVGDLGVEGEINLHALPTGYLREPLDPERPEELSDPQCNLAALDQSRRRSRIEVEDEDGWLLHSRRLRQRGMELEGGELCHPGQRRPVLAQAEVDLARAPVDVDRRRLHPFGAVLGAVLLEEGGLGVPDALGETPEGERAPLQVREHHVRDAGVVVDHLRLGGLRLRVEDLVEVGQLQPAVADRDLLVPLLCLSGQPRPLDLSLGLLARGAALAAPVAG
jgi:hypothetical protein